MSEWGRGAEDGTVYVKTAEGERSVGSWQAGSPEEGLAHFSRRFRAAYDVAGRAIASLGRDFPGAEDLLELQARALEEGTVRVAVLPVTSETGVEDALPVDWLREVED